MCNDTGEFFKPCTQAELDFYQSAQDTDFQDIMPEFMGWVKRVDTGISQQIHGMITENGVVNNQQQIAAALSEQVSNVPATEPTEPVPFEPNSKSIKSDTLLMLKDATSGFKRPNILDVKLGRVLCGDYAKEDKRKRLADIAKATTHDEYGFRIAGMRVFHGALSKDEDYEHNDSKDAKDPSKYISYNDESGYKIYSREYGKQLHVDDIRDSFREFVFDRNAGVTEDLGKAICSAFVKELENVRDVLTRMPVRMFSSSLLFVFEGDGDALEDAIEKNNEAVDLIAEVEDVTKPRYPTALRTDSGIVLNDDEYLDDEVSSELGERFNALPPMYSVKLIDFAHATWIPNEAPDENTMLGVRTLIDIFGELADKGLEK